MKPSAQKLPKEFADLRPGQPVLLIEYCSDCHTHNSSLRHDSEKYLNKAMEMKTAVQREFPFFKIVMRPLDVAKSESRQRLGLFEVFMASHDHPAPKLLGSKLKTLQWPEPRTVVSNIRGLFPGRQLVVSLKFPDNANFHPSNPFANSIKTVLLSDFDVPLFQERMLSMSRKAPATAMPRTRMLSGIVQKKIQSGIVQEAEINELVHPKTFVFEQKTSGELKLDFPSVRPGAYKFVVLADSNFAQTSQDVLILPSFRVQEGPVKLLAHLLPKKTALFLLTVESAADNPLFNISLQKFVDDGDQSQAEEELHFKKSAAQDGKIISSYSVDGLQPGSFKLALEFKDFKQFTACVKVHAGFNSFKLSYPSMELVFRGEDKAEPSTPKQVEPSEISVQGSQKKLKTVLNSAKKSAAKSSFGDKENMANRQQSDFKNDRPSSRPATELDRGDNDDKMPFQKQRGASGNRIRPGERLYSAKSKSNQQPTEEGLKNQLIVQGPPEKFKNDPSFQVLEKSITPNWMNIFLKISPQFKLNLEFIIDKMGPIIDQSQFYQEGVVDGRYEKHCLRHFPMFEYFRVMVERSPGKLEEGVELFLVNNRRVTKVNLSEFFKQYANEDEVFCDIAFVINNASQTDFEELVSLVPLAEPIRSFTGIQEIKSIINFVRNSKFGVEKFFGFEEEADEGPRTTLSRNDVIESLHNYEIEFSNPYVLNAVRVDKKGTVSLQKLHEVYAMWQRMAEGLTDVEFEDYDSDIEEQDEEFETGGNVEMTEGANEDEEFKDDEFDD